MLTSLGNPGVTITVVQPDPSLAVKVSVEHLAVAVVFPPEAQLAIPRTVQSIDETGKLVAQQRVKVLIAQVPAEVILLHQTLHLLRLQVLRIESGSTHSLKVQHDNARVKAWVSVPYPPRVTAAARVRVIVRTSQCCARILGSIKIKSVPVDRRQFRRKSKQVVSIEEMELVEQQLDIGPKHHVAVDQDAPLHLRIHDSMHAQRQVK